MDTLCGALRTDFRALAFWDRRCADIAVLKDKLDCPLHSACLEVCPKTWAAEGTVRLHLHVALQRSSRPICLDSVAELAIDGAVPHISAARGGNLSRLKKTTAGSAHYYCQCPKVGQLFMVCTHQAFIDFPVNPEWITNFLSAEKVTHETARQQYVRSGKNLAHHLQNLEQLQMEKMREAVTAKQGAINRELAGQLRPQRVYPLLRDRWLPYFQTTRPRYPFLVIAGPSGMGKTVFVKWLFGDPAKVFEVNCASTPEPDLRQFNPVVHEAILFDEASPQMVLDQRKLFQAPPCWVDLGCSTTNCHKYQVFVSGKKLIICSNSWVEATAELRHPSDREWLRVNSVVLKVQAPMWIEGGNQVAWECM